jgi:hypothetical protein
MSWPTLTTYDRIDPEGGAQKIAEDFQKPYLGIRLVIGVIGVALPTLLVVVDGAFIDTALEVRGSMSQYYHSPARDLFVGGLAACGVILASYMFWKWRTWDFWISLVGGLGVLGVAAFPTGRPRFAGAPDQLECSYSHADVPPCTALQQLWGEGNVRTLHVIATAIVVGAFAGLCLVFALRDFGYGKGAHELVQNDKTKLGPVKILKRLTSGGGGLGAVVGHVRRKAPRTVLYLVCLLGVLVGAAWAALGPSWWLPHSYAGEFLAFSSFGTAWIIASWDLLKGLVPLNNLLTGVGEKLGVDTSAA